MHYCFISDLHLCSDSDSDALFNKFLKNYSSEIIDLYILGDLFEYWIGDDAMDSYHLSVAKRIKSLKNKVDNIYFMPGNRDFLVGKHFLELSGMQLIDDPHIVDVNNRRFLLSHGDNLCTFDHKYQRFRHISRNPIIKKLFLSSPISLRKKIASELRKEKKSSNDNSEIYDVNNESVKDLLSTHKAFTLIHGHTHKPGVHSYDEALLRVVLGDWHNTAKIVVISNKGILDLITVS